MVSPTTSVAPPRSATGGQIRRRVAEVVRGGQGVEWAAGERAIGRMAGSRRAGRGQPMGGFRTGPSRAIASRVLGWRADAGPLE